MKTGQSHGARLFRGRLGARGFVLVATPVVAAMALPTFLWIWDRLPARQSDSPDDIRQEIVWLRAALRVCEAPRPNTAGCSPYLRSRIPQLRTRLARLENEIQHLPAARLQE